ncbi:MAG: hypothetical protein AAFV46_04990, partial [Cyanobacteria bacterium J06635_11]
GLKELILVLKFLPWMAGYSVLIPAVGSFLGLRGCQLPTPKPKNDPTAGMRTLYPAIHGKNFSTRMSSLRPLETDLHCGIAGIEYYPDVNPSTRFSPKIHYG